MDNRQAPVTSITQFNNQSSMKKDFKNNNKITTNIRNPIQTTLNNSIRMSNHINSSIGNNISKYSIINPINTSNVLANNNNHKPSEKCQNIGMNVFLQNNERLNLMNVNNEMQDSDFSNIQKPPIYKQDVHQFNPPNTLSVANNKNSHIGVTNSILHKNNNIDRSNIYKSQIPVQPNNNIPHMNRANENNYVQQNFKVNNNNIIHPNKQNNDDIEMSYTENMIVCDDHLKKNQKIIAKRFCSHCINFLCDECVIQNHDSHIKDCKISIEEVLIKKQNELEKLNQNLFDLNEGDRDFNKKMRLSIQQKESDIRNDSDKKLQKIGEMKKYLDDIEKIERENCKRLIENINNLTKKEIELRNSNLNFDLNKNIKDLNNIKNKWEKLSQLEKSQFIKTNFLDIHIQNYEKIKQKKIKFSEDSNKLIKRICLSIDKNINNNNYFSNLDILITNTIDLISKVSQEEKAKFELIESDDFDEEDVSVRQNLIRIPNEKPRSNGFNKEGYDEFISSNKYNYEYLINFKGKEISYYDFNEKTIRSVSIENVIFSDENLKKDIIYDNSKSVNIGSSLIVTGGVRIKQETRTCFTVKIKKNQVFIYPFKSMHVPRQAHNIIYICDKNIILVCGGFYCKDAEYIEEGNNWIKISPMNKSRGNATLAYINEKYVCCLGGYEIVPNSSTNGKYLNSFEVLDLQSMNIGWRYLEFPINLSICALGVISLSSTTLLICGGYDGNSYTKETYKFKLEKNINGTFNPIIKKNNIELPLQTIFLHSNFCRYEENAYIFDVYNNLIGYNLFENSLR